MPPIPIIDASAKLDRMRELAALARSRGGSPAHTALAGVFDAAAGAFGCNLPAYRTGMATALGAAASLPMRAETRADVLTSDELATLRTFIEGLYARLMRTTDDETPADAGHLLRDAAAFDILILSQALSFGERTTFGPDGIPEDVVTRLGDARLRVEREDLIAPAGPRS